MVLLNECYEMSIENTKSTFSQKHLKIRNENN